MKQWKNLKGKKTKQIKKLSTQKSIYSKNIFQNKGEIKTFEERSWK